MRNRANIIPRDESAFINGGTAGTDKLATTPEKTRVVSKAKPVSISLFDDNLRDIDNIIRDEMVSGSARVNRSDVVRAAVEALKRLDKSVISTLIKEAKQK
jgi:chromosome partitioning protein